VTQGIDDISISTSGMKHQADGALVNRLWQGDLTAMETLYDRYGRLVYGLALKGLGRVTEAEDLTQDVFLTLVRTRAYRPSRGSLASYLTTLTRSRAVGWGGRSPSPLVRILWGHGAIALQFLKTHPS